MKHLILLFIGLFLTNNSYSQEDLGFTPGGGQFRMAIYGEPCKNLTREADLAKCSQDQIKEYISELKTPEIVEKKKLNVTTIITFNLSEEGKVVDVAIKKSSGNKEVDQLCLEHIKKMKNWEAEISDNMNVATSNLNLKFHFKYTPKEKK